MNQMVSRLTVSVV